MKTWNDCKNILVIRPDNMGDLIMSGPAIRALKETFAARITVLTSSMAAGVARFMPEIDEVMIFDTPWVKSTLEPDRESIQQTVDKLRLKQFDGAVIFTVYSQNPLPSAMMAYMAGIPKILAYCRENPYGLITDWVPDQEPYEFIRHQVRRDLDLVKSIGAVPENENLHLEINQNLWPSVQQKLTNVGLDVERPWLILHPGVSERKREYPIKNWVKIARKLITEEDCQVVFTGSKSEKLLTGDLSERLGTGSISAGGMFTLEEFICLIQNSSAVISVNTGTVHIAAAVGTPLVVLYAQSNPQHTPWNVPNWVLPYSIPKELQSKNQVIAHVNEVLYTRQIPYPSPDDVIKAVDSLVKLQPLSFQPFHGISN